MGACGYPGIVAERIGIEFVLTDSPITLYAETANV
jgi:hypothetical protein